MSNIKVVLYKTRLHVAANLLAQVWPPSILCNHYSVIVVVRKRPRAIPLAMNYWKINSSVSFTFLYRYGAPIGGSPELHY